MVCCAAPQLTSGALLELPNARVLPPLPLVSVGSYDLHALSVHGVQIAVRAKILVEHALLLLTLLPTTVRGAVQHIKIVLHRDRGGGWR
jgi:hypothetical protein